MPDAAALAERKMSAEVAHYMLSRGLKLPEPWQAPLFKTPEASETVRAAVFSAEAVDKVLNTFRHLVHTKGQWAGRPLTPDPWQVAYILAPVFGWVEYDKEFDDYIRIVRECWVEVPRKNGKSTLIGGLGIYMSCADGEAGAECVAAATTERQAGFVFDPVRSLVNNSPALKPYAKAYRKKIIHLATASEFAVVSSVAEGMHGANLHFYCVDEVHVHKSAELIETIETGTGSRRQPLGVLITTADDGAPDTVYVRKRHRIVQLAQRVYHDATTYGVIWAAAESEEDARERGIDVYSEHAQRLANPGYGVSPTKAYLKRQAVVAAESPADLSKYLRLHLGIRTKQQTTYLTIASWDNCSSVVDEARLVGRRAFGGLDLASASDFCAYCLIFPSRTGEDDGTPVSYDVLWRFYVPEGALPALEKRTTKGLIDQWRREGRMTVTTGNVTDYDAIKADIERDRRSFDVAEVAYDPWNSTQIVNDLTTLGLDMVPVRQGYASLSPPLKELKRLLLASTPELPLFRHGSHPIARWMVGNLAVAMDPAGNVKPDRKRSADKIDGVASANLALSRAMAAPPERKSAYEERGLSVVGGKR
jgi:phage terminase large subunit-like protein